jgi:long-chain fatty acid transport protein
MKRMQRKTTLAALAASLGALPGVAAAAGFALLEQNASGLGNAFAGTAAVAEDASTIFFNPAGMTLLPGAQVVLGGSGIYVNSEFDGDGSATPPFTALGTETGGNLGGWALVPAAYFSLPIGERLAIGVGVGAPFGLKTEYEDDWLGRYQGIKSELKTINVNPSIAFKLTDAIHLGAGVNWQQADAELTNAVFAGLLGEGETKLEADDDAWGWNVGALFVVGPDMRIGLSYRSSLDYTLEGDVTAEASGVTVADFDAEADIEFPDSFILSVTQMFGDKWQLLGDVQYTHWSTIGEVDVVNQDTNVTADTLVFDFDNAWRIALGVRYFMNERWTLKFGAAWDESPVNEDNRTVRLPDADRYWLSVGAKYRFAKGGAIDLGYSHLFGASAEIDQTRALGLNAPLSALSTTVDGEYDNSVDIIGVQLTWTF